MTGSGVRAGKYGCEIRGLQVIALHSDKRLGHWLLLKADKQELEIRVTPSGLLRIGQVRQAGPLSIDDAPAGSGY